MKRLIWAGLALQLCAGSGVAQTITSPASTPPGAQPPTGAPGAAPMSAAPVSPPLAGGPMAGSPVAAPMAGSPLAAPTPGSADTVGENAVLPGANSFTESQARSRLERNGFSQVSRLTKDGDGIWRGSASKNGAEAHVAVDFKGNISMN
jgi:hypothetical protein